MLRDGENHHGYRYRWGRLKSFKSGGNDVCTLPAKRTYGWEKMEYVRIKVDS